jgi:SRSO17 transposase
MSQRNKSRPPRLKDPPPSGQKPSMNLAPREVEAMAEELVAYHELFQDLFRRPEQREWCQVYLQGQLSDLERKTVEPMVLALKGADAAAVRAGQQFLGAGAWPDQAILARHQQLVGGSLGEPDGVVIVDGSGFPKKGQHSVGVARQYCGALGKVANCQHGIFTAYVSSQGYTFLDRRLYMPQEWFDEAHAGLRRRCGVPLDLKFQTEAALALEMLRELVRRGRVPFRWVTADEHYGRIPAFLEAVAALDKWYLAEVPLSIQVWLKVPRVKAPGQGPMGRPRKHRRVAQGEPPAEPIDQIAERLPKRKWRRYTIKEGSQGPLVAEFAFLRVTRSRRRRPGRRVWLVLRRSTGPEAEVKAYLSNAPAACAHAELARISGLRWPIESALEEGKGELGMDHYETRSWRGWHHHLTLTFLAHHFLLRMRLRLKKSPGPDSGSSASVTGDRSSPQRLEYRSRHRDHSLSPAA